MKERIILIGICILILIGGGCKPTFKESTKSLSTEVESYYDSSNSSVTFKNITAMIVIDCSLPEVYINETVEIVFGETVYNNTNVIEIPFTEFCERLKTERRGK